MSESRIANSQLVLVFKDQLQVNLPTNTYDSYDYDAGDDPVLLTGDAKDSVEGVRCTSITRPVADDFDMRFSKVISIGVFDEKELAVGVIGGGDIVFMTTSNLYIVKRGMQWTPWTKPTKSEVSGSYKMPSLSSFITRVELAKGTLGVAGVGKVDGTIVDRWSLHEFADEGVLSVISTTNDDRAMYATSGQRHHLRTLNIRKKDLRQIDVLDGFGDNEDIRAVRFLGCIGYVVTYRAVDPLYAFDFTDAAHPKIISELKIPGFSGYLHPVATGRLLGVGFDTIAQPGGQYAMPNGVQVSLFDTSDPESMSRIDNKVLGGPSSRSVIVPDGHAGVTIDAHAFYFDPSRSLIGIPVALGGSYQSGDQTFAGAVLFKLGEESLTEVGRISHKGLANSPSTVNTGANSWYGRGFDITRIFTVDDRLISVSSKGLIQHDWNNLESSVVEIEFGN